MDVNDRNYRLTVEGLSERSEDNIGQCSRSELPHITVTHSPSRDDAVRNRVPPQII